MILNWLDKVLYIGNHLIKINNGISGTYIVKSGTKCIAGSAFSNCTGLTSITIPNSVTSIGNSAFEDCAGLTKVNYSGTIEQWCGISFSNFFSNPICYAHKLYISDELVTEAVIPGSVTEIKQYAFSNCTGLKSITIGNSVTSIGEGAFYYCTGLTSITIGNSVTSIGDYAFYNCTGLTSVTIGNSATSIGDRAFYNCDAIFHCNASADFAVGLTSAGFSIISPTCTDYRIKVYKDSKDVTYINAIEYLGKDKNIVIPDKIDGVLVKSIGSSAFKDNTEMTSVTIPNTIESIGESAFYNCTSLGNVTMGIRVQNIGEDAFFGCSGITSLSIPAGCSTIGKNAFYLIQNINYTGSASCVFEEYYYNSKYDNGYRNYTNTNWGAYNLNKFAEGNFVYTDSNKTTLCGCSTLTDGNVVIPSTVTTISSLAFENCDKITSVSFPEGIQKIESKAFYDCDSLEKVTISNGTIGTSAFENCDALAEVELGNGVTSVGSSAFYDCDKLEKATIISGSIGTSAFENCDNLATIELGNGVTSVGEKSFFSCGNLASIKLCRKDTRIGCAAFYFDGNIASVSYVGIYEDRFNMVIDDENDYFINAPWNYNYNVPEELNSVSSVSVKSMPSKTSYQTGDTLNTAGLKLMVTYCDNSTKEITSGFTCTPTSFTTAGTKTVTVSYQGKTTTFNVTVTGQTKTLLAVSVSSNPSKLTYKVGDSLNTSGLKLTAVFSDGSTKEITSGFTCNPTVLSSAGAQTITVTYEGKTTMFNVTVNANSSNPDPADPTPSTDPVAGITETDAIKGNAANNQKTYEYKTAVTFNANVPEGGSVQWYVDDKPAGTNASLTVPAATKSYTVKVVVTDKNGGKTADTENVTIKSSFFDKLIYFFKHLFNPNAYIINQQ